MLRKILIAAALLGAGAYVYTKYQKQQKAKVPPASAPAVPAMATPAYVAPKGSTILTDTKRTLATVRDDLKGDLITLQDKLFAQ